MRRAGSSVLGPRAARVGPAAADLGLGEFAGFR